MGTVLRSELSLKNRYWLERHRYYELKHFCLQYPIWKKAHDSLDGLSHRSGDLIEIGQRIGISDPTTRCVESREFYAERMRMVEKAADETDPVVGRYILTGVTEGLSYDKINARESIPCCKDTYYEMYRRFFYLLNKIRG